MRSVLRICKALVGRNSHKHLRRARDERQIVLDHEQKFAGGDGRRQQSGASVMSLKTAQEWATERHVAGALHRPFVVVAHTGRFGRTTEHTRREARLGRKPLEDTDARPRSLRSAPCATRAQASAVLRRSLASASEQCCG
jgi:hypothetical protein